MDTRTVPPPAARGLRERGDSSWLGQPVPASAGFERHRDLDRWLLSTVAPFTGGLAPVTLAAAAADWWLHLLASPAKQLELAQLLLQAPGAAAVAALPQDKRFAAPAWRQWPFSSWAQGFLQWQQLWQHATEGVPGVSRHHEAMVAFGARQWLDMLSPSNFLCTNPVVLQRTAAESGANLWRGAALALQDAWLDALGLPPAGAEAFAVGRNLATTPGQVVMHNRLAELIQYDATTPQVRPEPLLLVPAWLMKYYVLDLSAHNSLVRALVAQGFTVFVLSWKNPTPEDRETSLDDYAGLGVAAALDTIARIRPATPVHALGYCLGGTLMAMVAARLARTQPQALKSLTLLTAQTDFSDPGELGLFIDEGQLEMLEDTMWRQGVLQARQLKGTFQMMRSQDLIWSYRVISQLLGERPPLTDLMAWNADGTRLPYRAHAQVLRQLYLENRLARGRMELQGQALNLADIRVPVFSVGAVQDHVAPWRSVFKLHALTDAEQTFVLTAGGHNVGIVNPPGAARTSRRLRRWRAGERLLTPDEWLDSTPVEAGSWWTPWFAWLQRHSGRWIAAPAACGAAERGVPPLGPAPGLYVLER